MYLRSYVEVDGAARHRRAGWLQYVGDANHLVTAACAVRRLCPAAALHANRHDHARWAGLSDACVSSNSTNVVSFSLRSPNSGSACSRSNIDPNTRRSIEVRGCRRRFDANLVLADLQLVYWPLRLLQESFEAKAGPSSSRLPGTSVVLYMTTTSSQSCAAARDGSIDLWRPALRYHMTIVATEVKSHSRHVYLQAPGIICSLGSGCAEVYRAMIAGDQSGMLFTDAFSPGAPCFVGRVGVELAHLPASWMRFDSRNNRLLAAALGQIEATVRDAIGRFGRDRVGVVIGTSTSGILESENAVADWVSSGAMPGSYDYQRQRLSSGSDFLSNYLDIGGPSVSISTACSSSAHAFAYARRLLNQRFLRCRDRRRRRQRCRV